MCSIPSFNTRSFSPPVLGEPNVISGYFAATFSYTGLKVLQASHHRAQQSTMTMPSPETEPSKFPSYKVTIAMSYLGRLPQQVVSFLAAHPRRHPAGGVPPAARPRKPRLRREQLLLFRRAARAAAA